MPQDYLHQYHLAAVFRLKPCPEAFANYTAGKWRLEKKNHNLAFELAAYALT